MKNLSITAKVALLLLLPLLSIGFYALKNIHSAYNEWQSLTATESLMDLAIGLGNASHDLQIERGATAGFVQSRGEKFATELPGFRANTDRQLQALQAQFERAKREGLPPQLQQKLQDTFSATAKLADTRAAASSFSIPAAEASAFFTKTIGVLLDTIPTLTEQSHHLTLVKRMTGYLAFLQAKERTGQERALMVPVFTADSIEPAQYRAFIGHMAAQQALLGTFNGYATDDLRSLLQQKSNNEYAHAVGDMRKVVLDKAGEGGFGIDPTRWFKAITSKINDMHDIEAALTQQIQSTASALARQARSSMIWNSALSLASLLATLVLGYWIAQSIVRPINRLRDTITSIEQQRDLTRRIDIEGNDEVAQTAAAFNRLTGSLRQSIAEVGGNAGQVLALSAQLATTSLQAASNAESQSAAASAMASAVEQLTVSIDQVSDHSGEARDTSANNNKLAGRGGEVILRVVQDMHSIAETVHQSSGIIANLGQQSERIYSIVQAIKEIADQTNLLALNAAIEAARAGEQGRGFAVVADEVRKLAERTTHATREIGDMIQNIQNGTRDAVASMEVGVQRVGQGVDLAGQAGDAIREIQQGAGQVGVAVSDISSALHEQSAASGEISRHVEKVAQMTEENSAAARSNAAAARNLEALAEGLRRAVEQFRT